MSVATEEINKLLRAKRGKDTLIRVRAQELSEALVKEREKREGQPDPAYLKAIEDILNETLKYMDPVGDTAVMKRILAIDENKPFLPGVDWKKARERTGLEKAIRQHRTVEGEKRQQSLKDKGKEPDVLLTGDKQD